MFQLPTIQRLETRKLFDSEIDTAFSNDGFADVTFDGQTGSAEALDVAIAPDGKVVVAGYATVGSKQVLAVARFNENGTLDNTFDGDGKMTIDGAVFQAIGNVGANAVAVQSDGKIVVLVQDRSSTQFPGCYVSRLTTTGQLDPTFDSDGVLPASAGTVSSLDIDSQGRIVFSGRTAGLPPLVSATGYVRRVLTDGSPDPTFNGTSVNLGLTYRPLGQSIDADDNVYIVGRDDSVTPGAFLFKVTEAGAFDSSFSGDGKVFSANERVFDDVEVAPNGEVLVGGDTTGVIIPQVTMTRYSSTGTLINRLTYSAGTNSTMNEVEMAPDGKTYSIAYMTDSTFDVGFIRRQNANLTVDNSYGLTVFYFPVGNAATTDTHVMSAALTPTGRRLYLAGSAAINQTGVRQFSVAALVAAEPVTVANTTFGFEQGQEFKIQFEDPINQSSLNFNDLEITQQPSGTIVNPAYSFLIYNPTTRTATYALNTPLPDGSYQMRLRAGSVSAPNGLTNETNVDMPFFFLAADANRDRIVDTQDFNRLAANFGGSNKVFSEGNFNYDSNGAVDSADFNLLIGQFGKRVAAPTLSGPVISPFASATATDDESPNEV